MAILLDWKIKSRSGVCHHTERAFEDEEKFYTCIFDDPESDAFIRRDFSLQAWKEVSKDLDPAPYSFWKSVFKAPSTDAKANAQNKNSVEAMLHRMIEEDRSETENARYILALMLERKKILIPTEVKESDTRTLLFYEHKDTGSVYIVADPLLKLDQIGQLQEDVSALLEAEEKRNQSAESEELPKNDGETDGTQPKENSEQPT